MLISNCSYIIQQHAATQRQPRELYIHLGHRQGLIREGDPRPVQPNRRALCP
jgi:hypothetical protein